MSSADVQQFDSADRWRVQGDALLAAQYLEEAIESYNQGIVLTPDDARLYNNRGTALKKLGRFTEALESYDWAIALMPERAELHSNRAAALYALRRFQDAIDSYDTAIRLMPDNADALWNKALIHLLLGQFKEGWVAYEARTKRENTPVAQCSRQAVWSGDAEIAGKTLLVHWEQGYGDVILFSRFVRLCRRAGARVLFASPKPLKGLMQGLHADVSIVDIESDTLFFDYHCSLMSLPFLFRRDLADVSRDPYLSADQDKVDSWSRRLGKKLRPRVGVVWDRSGPADSHRSITLEAFQRLFDPRLDFIVLQKQVTAAERDQLNRLNIIHPGTALYDFSDTAALCDLMDLVITIDTSVAHLAGALGRPVWVLLPSFSSWIWRVDRDDSLWYPSARLFRQSSPGDWDEVLRRVQSELGTLFGLAP